MQWNAPSASEIAGAEVMKRIAAPQVGGRLLGDDSHAVRHSPYLCDLVVVERRKRRGEFVAGRGSGAEGRIIGHG